jgi:hypothetical protein
MKPKKPCYVKLQQNCFFVIIDQIVWKRESEREGNVGWGNDEKKLL